MSNVSTSVPKSRYPSKCVNLYFLLFLLLFLITPEKLLWKEVLHVFHYDTWGRYRVAIGTRPVVRSHHRANWTRSGTVPLRSNREVVGSFRNNRTQWNGCELGRPVAFRCQSCGVDTALGCDNTLTRLGAIRVLCNAFCLEI